MSKINMFENNTKSLLLFDLISGNPIYPTLGIKILSKSVVDLLFLTTLKYLDNI